MKTLIDTLPLAALVTVHNSLTKNTVKKFENRTKAKRRIEDLLKNHGGVSFDQAARDARVAPPLPYDDDTLENPDDTDPVHEDKTDTTDDETGHGDKVEDDARYGDVAIRQVAELPATGPDVIVRLTANERHAISQLLAGEFPAALNEPMRDELLARLRTAPPAPAPKPARTTKARTTNPRTEGMTANQRAIINLCSRPEGATGKELADGCGWPSIAARTTCQKLADKFGYWLSETPKTKTRGIAFKLTPQEPTHPIA